MRLYVPNLTRSPSVDSLQGQLISMGVIPTLVKLLGIHSHNAALTEMCLIAFGNLAELGEFRRSAPNAKRKTQILRAILWPPSALDVSLKLDCV